MYKLPDPTDDGLIKMSVGEWSRDKHHFLRRYIDAFTVAMKNKKWDGLHYIDLFAGPGLLELKNTKELIWGSPLIAAHCNLFNTINLCDIKPKYATALQSRIQNLKNKDRIKIHKGDANSEVNNIVQTLPSNGLSLAFLDPHGLHLHFSTLKVLASKRTDLIIFFPDHLDALRNCEFLYHDQPDSNLDKVLNNSDWRSATNDASRDQWAEIFRDIYVEQIKMLGYRYFEYERIYCRNRPLYLLIFCSRHPAGATIWRNTSRMKPDGQRTFGFD